jgi:hypothetical protein
MKQHQEIAELSNDAVTNTWKSRSAFRVAIAASLVAASVVLAGCGKSEAKAQDPRALDASSGTAYGYIVGSDVSKKYLGLFGPDISTVYLDICEDSSEITDPLKDLATRESALDEIENCTKVPAVISYQGVTVMQDIEGVMVKFEEDGDGITTSADLVGPLQYPED